MEIVITPDADAAADVVAGVIAACARHTAGGWCSAWRPEARRSPPTAD